jgi:hypothetical protein
MAQVPTGCAIGAAAAISLGGGRKKSRPIFQKGDGRAEFFASRLSDQGGRGLADVRVGGCGLNRTVSTPTPNCAATARRPTPPAS